MAMLSLYISSMDMAVRWGRQASVIGVVAGGVIEGMMVAVKVEKCLKPENSQNNQRAVRMRAVLGQERGA